jgi:hypothetical protein
MLQARDAILSVPDQTTLERFAAVTGETVKTKPAQSLDSGHSIMSGKASLLAGRNHSASSGRLALPISNSAANCSY